MKKRILLIGYNFHPEPTGIGKYSGEMIAWLARKGYDCEVVTAYPYYPFWKVQDAYSKKKYWYSTEYQSFEGCRVKVHRCPIYVPSIPTSIKRMLLDLSFLISAFIKVLLLIILTKRFDYVVTVVPCFQFGLLGVFYKKIRRTVLLYHIQDLQIEAAKDLNLIKSRLVLNSLFTLEKYILGQSDVITSISEAMVRKVRMKSKKDVYLFENWTDCERFYPIEQKANLKEEFGFKASDKVVLYSGAVGEKQGLEAILYAAEALKHQTNLKFIICGSGPYKQKLISLSNSLKLHNLIFLPLQPIEKFNSFLNMADVHLVIQKSKASDLVMPSKLTTVLSVGGLALVTASKGTSLYTCVSCNKIGLMVEPEQQNNLNEAILNAIVVNHENIKINARHYAEERLSIDKIMLNFSRYALTSCTGYKSLKVQ